jgi:mannose-6-phosphate isomerase-like protein (cupin superfamily)
MKVEVMPPIKLNILGAVDRQIDHVFDPHVVGDVNESQVKVAKFGEVFDWHAHADEDEAFLVLRGRIAIDFRDGTVELNEGDFVVVPRKVEHRPRSLTTEPVVLMFEPSTTLNTGNAQSDLTVHDLKRLRSFP